MKFDIEFLQNFRESKFYIFTRCGCNSMGVATLCHGEIVCHVEIGLTALQPGISQVRFPMGLLIFITGLKLPAVLCSWGRLNLQKNEYYEYLVGVKAASASVSAKFGISDMLLVLLILHWFCENECKEDNAFLKNANEITLAILRYKRNTFENKEHLVKSCLVRHEVPHLGVSKISTLILKLKIIKHWFLKIRLLNWEVTENFDFKKLYFLHIRLLFRVLCAYQNKQRLFSHILTNLFL